MFFGVLLAVRNVRASERVGVRVCAVFCRLAPACACASLLPLCSVNLNASCFLHADSNGRQTGRQAVGKAAAATQSDSEASVEALILAVVQ